MELGKELNISSVAVHDEIFHSDDVLAVALLKILNPRIEVVRTRDPDVYSKANIRVDVGLKYDPETGDFDHHQKNAFRNKDVRVNDKWVPGPTMCGFGLLWHNYGRYILKHYFTQQGCTNLTELDIDWAFTHIRKSYVIPVDVDDNGEWKDYSQPDDDRVTIRPVSFSDIIRTYIPTTEHIDTCSDDISREMILNTAFEDASEFAVRFLKKIFDSTYSIIRHYEHVKICLDTQIESNLPYFILHRPGNFFANLNRLRYEYRNLYDRYLRYIDLYIYPVKENSWRIQTAKQFVPNPNGGKSILVEKCLHPSIVRGLSQSELREITGIKNITFVAESGWIAGTETLEDAIELAKWTIKYNTEIYK